MVLKMPIEVQQKIEQLPFVPTASEHRLRSPWRGLLPRKITREGIVLDQHIREGRFQRSLSLITAFSSLVAGLEVTYEHFQGSYSQRIMYSPVLLTPPMVTRRRMGSVQSQNCPHAVACYLAYHYA